MFSSILHSLIAHHDLKPENVLMISTNEKADLRVLDFGLSKLIEPYGILSYVAPEVLLDILYGKEVDFGVLVLLLIYVRWFFTF